MHARSTSSGSQNDYLRELASRGFAYLSKYRLLPENGASKPKLPRDLAEFEGPSLKDKEALANFIDDKPHLQLLLSRRVDYTPSRWLLTQEIPEIRCRRELRCIQTTEFDPDKPDVSDPYLWARQNSLQGICLSGGGIRSATLCLGILQGLAQRRMVGRFDYLSSVSGGGYIHEWLAAWVKREEAETPGAGFWEVEKQLTPLPAGANLPLEPEPIRWLRRYSNYLTPQKGLFTADTWVMGGRLGA